MPGESLYTRDMTTYRPEQDRLADMYRNYGDCESCQDGEHAECEKPKDTVCVYAGSRYGYSPEPPEYAVSDCCCGELYTPDIADEGPDEDYVRENDYFDDYDPGI